MFFNVTPTPVAATLAIPCKLTLTPSAVQGSLVRFGGIVKIKKMSEYMGKVNEWVKPGALRSQQQVSLVLKEDLAHLRPGGFELPCCAQYCPLGLTDSSSPIREQSKTGRAGMPCSECTVYTMNTPPADGPHWIIGAQGLLEATEIRGAR